MTDAFVPSGRPHHEFGGSDRQATRRSGCASPARSTPAASDRCRRRFASTTSAPADAWSSATTTSRSAAGSCLQIDLPGEGWITVEAETLYLRANFGFAVRFVDLSDANRGRIERTIERSWSSDRAAQPAHGHCRA